MAPHRTVKAEDCVATAKQIDTSETAETAGSAPLRRRRNLRWGAPLCVWGTWAILLLGVLLFISRYGQNVPGWDEWHWVPVLVGEQPLTAAGLWEKFSEHRVPLPRLTLFALAKLSGCDFRAGMFVSALLLGGLSLALILVAKRLRAWTAYSDAFFPLALLHFGHAENLLQGWNIAQITSALLAGVMLAMIVQSREALAPRRAVLAGVCLLLLPMNGAQGMPFVPALVAWLAYSGILSWRSLEPRGRRNGLVTMGLAAAALLLVPPYFLAGVPGIYQQLDDLAPPSEDWADSLRGSVEFLATGYGTAWGPAPSSTWLFAGLGVLGLLLFSASALAIVWWKQPQERFRTLGLLCFLGAMAALALGIGWGRSGLGPGACCDSRYAASAVPLLCCVYCLAVVYDRQTAGRFLQAGLFVLFCVLFLGNLRQGLDEGESYYAQKQAFTDELLAGMPAEMLAQRHAGSLNESWSGKVFPELVEQMAVGIRMLGRAQVGVFKHLQEDPPFREEAFPVVPISANPPIKIVQMTWEEKGGVAVGTGEGDAPSLVWTLKRRQFVRAIRVTYAYEKASARAAFQMFWRDSSQNDFTGEERNATFELKARPEEKTVTVWVNEVIDSFRIDPDKEESIFRVSEIVLLLPAEDRSAPADRP